MKDITHAQRSYPQRLLAVTAAVVLTAGLGGIALAKTSSGSARTAIGSESKISGNQAGAAGTGLSFISTKGQINKYGGNETDGPVLSKKGTYFVNVNADLNVASYTSGGSGYCALDLVKGSTNLTVKDQIFTPWSFPGGGFSRYLESTSGMVSAPGPGYQIILACFDSATNDVLFNSSKWLTAPVTTRAGATVSAVPAITRHVSATHPDFGGSRG